MSLRDHDVRDATFLFPAPMSSDTTAAAGLRTRAMATKRLAADIEEEIAEHEETLSDNDNETDIPIGARQHL